MTTLTGSTPKTLAGTREPPTFGLAMTGACSQLMAVGYVWGAHTTAGQCMTRPIECLSDVRQADPWGRQVLHPLPPPIIFVASSSSIMVYHHC